jgi:hypothetical protein
MGIVRIRRALGSVAGLQQQDRGDLFNPDHLPECRDIANSRPDARDSRSRLLRPMA